MKIIGSWALVLAVSPLAIAVEGRDEELKGPAASAQVQAALDEASRLLEEKAAEESLGAATRGLAEARSRTDAAGEGLAHAALGRAFEMLERNDDALSAWEAAAAVWVKLDAGPERIEAVCACAGLLTPNQPDEVSSLVEEVVRLAQAEERRPHAAVAALNQGADRMWAKRAIDAMKLLSETALAIGEKHAPGSLDVARSLNKLGILARSQGDLAASRDYHLRASEIREKQAPGSLDLAGSLGNLGIVSYFQGELVAARGYHLRALEIQEKRAPGSIYLARSLNNLGLVTDSQGDLAAARDYYLRALEIQEKQASGSPDVAMSLNNLGIVAFLQGDLAAARDYHLRALEIDERHAPGSLDIAGSFHNLGKVAYSQGDLVAARDYGLRALEIKEKHAPGSLEISSSLLNLGNVAFSQGDLAASRDYYLRALAIDEKHAPGSLEVATSLHNLGLVAASQGDLAASRNYHLRALEIREKNAPGSLDVAQSFDGLGTLATTQEDRTEAERRHAAAWRIVRGQRRVVSGDEAGRGFAASFTEYATHLVEARIALRKNAEAFGVLEEARAQGLLQLLSRRGLGPSQVDPALWSRYETSEQVFLRASNDLSEAGAEAGPKHEAALSAYTQARLEQERILGEVRRSVPGFEARTFSFDETRRALPRNSVFVAWSLGEKKSAVFVIPSDPKRPVEARMLELDEKQIGERVAALRERIGSAGRVRGIGGLAETSQPDVNTPRLVADSRALYAALFPAGARAAIKATERVILSPDGALWELPFAALVTNSSGEPAWLGLDKPVSYTPSLTVLALERESPRSSKVAAIESLVVGDPVFVRKPVTAVPMPASSEVRLRGESALLAVNGTTPERLPATAGEARQVAALYGTVPLLGEAATESAVRGRMPRASVVHLATHGLFHPSLAMSSGVLLAPPEVISIEKTEDDGTLQAWEFGRTLPLVAELVVLSACETGRGEKARGEGLVGLTRALLAAGARSVVASQWKVADESTAELMVAFHGMLRRGVAKDEALRQAMAVTAGRKTTRHPFFWAPFFLTGDADRPLVASKKR